MTEVPIGTKVVIIDKDMVGRRTGTLVRVEVLQIEETKEILDDKHPVIKLDSGQEIRGFECWWMSIEEYNRACREAGRPDITVNYLGVEVPEERICEGCWWAMWGTVIYGHCWNCQRCPPEHTREQLMRKVRQPEIEDTS